jgi:hypothetical protein
MRRLLLLVVVTAPLWRLRAYAQDPAQTVQTLVNSLRESSESSDSALRAGQTLWEMWSVHAKEPDSPINRAIRSHEKALEEVLESSESRRVRVTVGLILYGIDTPEARAARLKNVEREAAERRALDAAKANRETTPQSREQLMAAVRMLTELDIETLSFVSMTNLLPDDESLLMTMHENRNAQLVQIWRKDGDRYVWLRSLPITDRNTSSFGHEQVFTFGGEQFLLLSEPISGTGLMRVDHIYHLDRATRSMQDVAFNFIPLDYKLGPDEFPRRGPFVTYQDDNISFYFPVLCNDCSDIVSGKYFIGRNAEGAWIMRPSDVVRGPFAQ